MTTKRTPHAIEAVERHRKASKQFNRCSTKLSKARDEAVDEHGREPYALIHWRNFYVGGSELKRVRQDLLRLGNDPATIEDEYIDAKKRYRVAVKAAKDWEQRAGVDGLCAAMEEARIEFFAAGSALGTVTLNSVADASALLELIRPEVKHGDIQDWEVAALNNAAKYLAATVAATA